MLLLSHTQGLLKLKTEGRKVKYRDRELRGKDDDMFYCRKMWRRKEVWTDIMNISVALHATFR